MACGAGWRAAVAALGLYCVCLGPAHAADDEDATAILFSGRDLWRNGAFAYGGLLVAPGGFDHDGLLFKLLISGGLYRYNSGYLGAEVVGAEWLGQALAGWRVKRYGVEMKFFLGPDWERHKLWPDDPGNRLRGIDFGLRMAAEFWTEPTANTMLTGELSLSTVATNASARLATGWRVLQAMFEDGFYVGPELQYFSSAGYRHTRFGVHLTELKTNAYEWSAAAGWAVDSDRQSSPYVRLNVMTRR